jgi:hypothetical protein
MRLPAQPLGAEESTDRRPRKRQQRNQEGVFDREQFLHFVTGYSLFVIGDRQ